MKQLWGIGCPPVSLCCRVGPAFTQWTPELLQPSTCLKWTVGLLAAGLWCWLGSICRTQMGLPRGAQAPNSGGCAPLSAARSAPWLEAKPLPWLHTKTWTMCLPWTDMCFRTGVWSIGTWKLSLMKWVGTRGRPGTGWPSFRGRPRPSLLPLLYWR